MAPSDGFSTLCTAACVILGIIFGRRLARWHFDAIYMMGALLGFVGLMLRTNALGRTRSRKAYTPEGNIYDFTPGLAVAATGIVVILAALYAYFW